MVYLCPVKREIIITNDGSTTIHLPVWNEQYHSKHGALEEAYHVFIKNGLYAHPSKNLHILEMGFGTGLNCFITLIESHKTARKINYTALEAYPILEDEVLQLNYVNLLETRGLSHKFEEMHFYPWGEEQKVSPHFTLTKLQQRLENFNSEKRFDVIYFDAFGARVQPELWKQIIFQKMYELLSKGGIFTTYSAKGSVRRAMQAVGFSVQKLPGPPGKREMLQGVKLH